MSARLPVIDADGHVFEHDAEIREFLGPPYSDLTWAQTYRGIPAFDDDLRVNVAGGGQVISVLGSPRGGLSVPSIRPRASARRALVSALRDARAARRGRRIGRPRLVLFGEQGGARLAWRFRVQASPAAVYDYVVDARSARVLRRADKVDSANALVYEYYPGAATGGTQAVQSLDSWLSPGATTLRGPNAHAYLDLNDTSTPTEIAPGSYAFSPVASASGLCPASGCAWSHSSAGSWSANHEEAANQAFYYVKRFHDHLAAAPISFSQFQGASRVNVEVDDGANTGPDDNHIDNANFSTPPSGSPRMQMYLFGKHGFSDVNGADDATVVYHEYTHGLSNRLVTDSGGNGALDTVQAGAMGEAWSDWYAMDFLAQQGYVSDTSTGGDAQAGAYTDGGQHLIRYQGINCPVGSSAASGCPGSPGAGQGGFTYADFGRVAGAPEVHADGEIWGETLWDLRQRMIADHPGDGVQRTETLVTRAMDLAPPQPSFLEMRNAILQEDSVAYANAGQAAIWDVFAHRGMGWFASTTDSSDTAPVADFSTPPSGASSGTVSGRVTDADSHAGVAGATAGLGSTGLGGTTDATGAYSISGVPAGTYPQMTVTAPGYDRSIHSQSVAAGQNTVDVSLRRDWAASAGGASVSSFTGPDYSGYGCGPYESIDQSFTSGWSTDAGTAQSVVVALPQAVDVGSFGIDPAGICGDDSSSALGAYRVDVSKDGHSWSPSASGSFGSGNVGRLNDVPASAAKGTRYVRLAMLSPQSSSGSGASYMDVAELEVLGVPAGFEQTVPVSPPSPPAGPVEPVKPTPAFSVSVAVGARQKLSTLLKRGLPVVLTCSARCTGAASLKVKRKALGAAMHEMAGGGRGRLLVRVSKRAAKKSLRKGRRWKLDLRLVVTGPQGRRSFSKAVTVSR